MDAGIKISLVAAIGKETRVIGSEGNLPWKLGDDLKNLRNLTLGKTIIVGRKTEESIVNRIGHSLPDRRTIVLTHNKDYRRDDCETASSWEEAIKIAKGEREIFVLGGEEIYELALPHADAIYLTLVETDRRGDAFFPELNQGDWDWELESKHVKNDKNEFNFSIWKLERKK